MRKDSQKGFAGLAVVVAVSLFGAFGSGLLQSNVNPKGYVDSFTINKDVVAARDINYKGYNEQ